MATTEAGLIVPDHAVEKKQRVLPNQTFKRMRHLITAMKDEGIGVVFGCRECNTPLNIAASDRIDDTKPGGRLSVVCKCTEREVR